MLTHAAVPICVGTSRQGVRLKVNIYCIGKRLCTDRFDRIRDICIESLPSVSIPHISKRLRANLLQPLIELHPVQSGRVKCGIANALQRGRKTDLPQRLTANKRRFPNFNNSLREVNIRQTMAVRKCIFRNG